ncbi:MAG: hypothetical protein WD080_06150 [Egibacteraceae bacterium]
MHRLLGADLTGSPDEVAAATAYVGPVLELLSDGLITEAAATRMRAAFTTPHEEHGEKEAGS